ncbi:carbohydrate ABC transporter permease [Tessaracoccus oleiagri]|uniref:Multiple sugar transport system permease protein n=1 Tax=Tessaracoccus oleiagri TaxID=686624 RepID=A0A1G9HJ00_9ACTN|nr:sugar ABC transporter permease [Tessaracoccus oleiagri]SDL12714.1 multiple sugar transport system permease protein [Tessaracoccus oleiagri]
MSWRNRTVRASAIAGLAFVLPAFILFIIFRFVPFIGGFTLAFAERTLGGEFTWVGMDNFERLAADPLFWHSLRVTIAYTLIVVPLTLALATGLALLVRRRFAGVDFFRAAFFMPVITSLVLAGIIFVWIFNAGGPVPRLMEALGLGGQSWITDRLLALPAIALVAAWSAFGYYMLVILARLNEIPREIEEAALVDRANAWARFRYITLPELRQVLFFLSVLSMVGSFQVFDAVYVMTQGGPVNATYTLGFMLYDQAFRFFDFGYASAVAVALFVLVFAITLIQRFLMGREDKA